ncbi:MAG: DUF4251 domain-containing protein [Flavobacteriaceae bacterium]
MKKLLPLLLVFLGPILLAQENSENDKFDILKQIITSEEFEFRAYSGSSVGGSTQDLLPHQNFLLSHDGTIKVMLDFFGSSQTITSYSGVSSDEIKFDGSPLKYRLKIDNKRKQVIVKFSGNNGSETLNFTFKIKEDRTGQLSVNSSGRSNIRYYGVLNPIKTSKSK